MNGRSDSVAGTTSVGTSSEFDWSDAGIGAGLAVGTMLVGAAGLLALRRHQHHGGQLAH